MRKLRQTLIHCTRGKRETLLGLNLSRVPKKFGGLMMIRRSTAAWALVLTLLAVLTAGGVWAANVHFKHGSPVFVDNGLTLTAAGFLTGLGQEDLFVLLTASANPTAVCTNPSGTNQPPGQNPAPVQVTGSEAIPASAVKNGNVQFNVTTNPPTTPIAGAPDCPGRSWTETITDMSFTCADFAVQQPPNATPPVLEQCFNLSGPASGTTGTLTATPTTCPCPSL
jgi:hypothetical protein